MKASNPKSKQEAGCLYVVSTPIGNFDDITLRALRLLNSVDLIAAEDTRLTGQLLAHHKIESRLISFHEHNEERRIPKLIDSLKEGRTIALVSDAGTPMVSDPGFKLIKAAIDQKIKVRPIPGVTAAVCGLSVSGLPSDAFVFAGFLPRKKGKRDHLLKGLGDEGKTIILYESPQRIVTLLKDLKVLWGDRRCVLGREMTKPHEEFLYGTLKSVQDTLEKRKTVKGECTLLVAGRTEDVKLDTAAIESHLKSARKQTGGSLTACAKEVARKLGLPKSRVYDVALKMKAAADDH